MPKQDPTPTTQTNTVVTPWGTPVQNDAATPLATPATAPQEGGVADPVGEPPKESEGGLDELEEEALEVASEVVEFVTLTIPKPFKLVLNHGHTLELQPGVQQMERAHAEHWYSRASGVQIYTP